MSAFAKYIGKGSAGSSGGFAMNTFLGNTAVASVLAVIGGVAWRSIQYREERNARNFMAKEKSYYSNFERAYTKEREGGKNKTNPAMETFELQLQMMTDQLAVPAEGDKVASLTGAAAANATAAAPGAEKPKAAAKH